MDAPLFFSSSLVTMGQLYMWLYVH